jgi:hypothetical protein
LRHRGKGKKEKCAIKVKKTKIKTGKTVFIEKE